MTPLARALMDAINYDVNTGGAGKGVTVAFMADDIDLMHPGLLELSLLSCLHCFYYSSYSSGWWDPAVDHGIMVGLLTGGNKGKEVYGVAYEARQEVVCCYTPRYSSYLGSYVDRQEEGHEYLAKESTAFAVSHSYDKRSSERLSIRISDQDRCKAIVLGNPAWCEYRYIDISIPDIFSSVNADSLYSACVAPEKVGQGQRLCVFPAGDEGLHSSGTTQYSPGLALDQFHVEDLLNPETSIIDYSSAMRIFYKGSENIPPWLVISHLSTDNLNGQPQDLYSPDSLLQDLYRRGGYMALPARVSRFEGHVLVVAALADEDSLADYSNGCGETKQYCLAAPGSIPFEICEVVEDATPAGICSGISEGTAYAASLVTGAAAVVKSTYPSLDAPTVSTILLTTAFDLGAPGVDDDFGWGRLDLGRALMSAGPQRTSAGVRLADTHVKAGSSMDAALAASSASFGMFDMHGRPYRHSVASKASMPQASPALSFDDWQHSSSALMGMDFEARMGLAGPQRGPALPGMLGLANLSGWDMGLEQCNLSCPSRRDVQVGSLVRSSALAWTQRHMQVPGGRMGLVLETGLEEGGMTYTNRGLFVESGLSEGLLRIEAGMLYEKATFMGSTFTGALDVRPGDSQYISASLGVPIGEHAFSAGYTLGKAKSGLVANSYVTEIDDVSYDAYRLAFGGERWELGYTVPLAAIKGGMRIESIGGYTGSEGDWSIVETEGGVVVLGEASAEDWSYRTDSHWIDLGAGSRERRLGLTMARPYGSWDMTFAVEHVANSPRRSFEGDEARAAVVLSLEY